MLIQRHFHVEVTIRTQLDFSLTPGESAGTQWRGIYWCLNTANRNDTKKLATIVKGAPKAPFSIAATPKDENTEKIR